MVGWVSASMRVVAGVKTNRSQHEYALLHLGQILGKAASGTSMGTSGGKVGCQWGAKKGKNKPKPA